ncbi:TRAP transporter small permease subunit [Oceanicella sp. SM1341]|uniref:TRAP transporter small permease subunit n=1 Tax=Oceanicella sp. SM1341 TaxID=1548889 RepID=UPI000E52EB92|nr:TRAP transporter small permease [Oceanicella sp. SM1341]
MKALSHGYSLFVAGLAWVAGGLICFLVVAIGAEAILRSLGLGVIRGVVDLSEHAMFNIAVLAAPWILRHNLHIRVDVVVTHLPKRPAEVAELLTSLAGLVTCAVITWYGVRVFATSWSRGELIFSELIIPDWWLQWQIPLAGALLVVEFARRVAEAARPLRSGAPAEPSAPRIEDGI